MRGWFVACICARFFSYAGSVVNVHSSGRRFDNDHARVGGDAPYDDAP